jgi:hypothetical protein
MRAGVPNAGAARRTVKRVLGTRFAPLTHAKGNLMNTIIYIVGAVVIIFAILSFLGLR